MKKILLFLLLALGVGAHADTLTYPISAAKGGTGIKAFASPNESINLSLQDSVNGSNDLTVNLKDASGGTLSSSSPGYVAFRNSAGYVSQYTYSRQSITAPLSITVSRLASLGVLTGATQSFYVYVLYDSTVDICVSASNFSETYLQPSTLISTASATATTLYCAASHTGSKPTRRVGMIDAVFSNPNWAQSQVASSSLDGSYPGVAYKGDQGKLNFTNTNSTSGMNIGIGRSGDAVLSSGDGSINMVDTKNLCFATNNVARGCWASTGGLKIGDASGNMGSAIIWNNPLGVYEYGGIAFASATHKPFVQNYNASDNTISVVNTAGTSQRPLVSSSGPATNGLHIVRGRVDNSSNTCHAIGTLNSYGEGWTCGTITVGTYQVNFSSTFGDTPVCTATQYSTSQSAGTSQYITVGVISSSAVTFYGWGNGSAQGSVSFDFICIGQRGSF